MRHYRASSAPAPAERCDVCGLEIEAMPYDDEPWRGLALETLRVLTEKRKHGDVYPCPGPPRLELVPLWRAVIELLVGTS